MVADNFFQTLKVQPALGRLFVEEECKKGGPAAVLLSDGFWRRRFGGDRAIIGQSIALNKQAATVVGVLPASFDFGSVFSPGLTIDVYVPAVMDEMRTWGNTLAVVGRLKPGATVAQAQAEAEVLFPQMKAAHPEWSERLLVDDRRPERSRQRQVEKSAHRALVRRRPYLAYRLCQCIELAFGARNHTQQGIRDAHRVGRRGRPAVPPVADRKRGARGRRRDCRTRLAFAITAYVSRQGSIALPLLSSVTVDRAALLWTLLITSVTALLFGSVPGLRLSSGNMQETLKASGPGMTAGRSHERLRTFMVMSQVGLACVLLISAGLLLRSFLNVLDVDLGFQPEQAAVIKIDYEGGDGPRRGVVLQKILRNITSIPGIESAGIADMLPLGRNRSWGFQIERESLRKERRCNCTRSNCDTRLSQRYGNASEAGTRFLLARCRSRESVVIINEAAARLHWPGVDPVGRMALTVGNKGWQPTEVIGLISDVREHSLEASADPEMYLPAWQAGPEGAELVVRTKLTPASLTPAVMKTLRALNPGQPATELRPLRHIVDQAVSPRRFFVLLVTCFAALGLVLAALGIFGIVSYSVTQRRQEIGIRMALGASTSQVQKHVIARAMQLVIAGAIIGTVSSFAVGKWIASLLFATRPTDPVTFLSVFALLVVVALAAGFVPARRASRIEPMIALRSE